MSLFHIGTEVSNGKQQDDRCDTNRSIKLGVGQRLECVDDDLVRGVSRVNARNAERTRDLSRHDGDTCGSDEGRDGDVRDEFDDPSQSEESKEE